MNIVTQLGMRIKFLRKSKKLSQLDLSLEAGVNKNYISDLEKGRRNPTILVLNKIAVALNIDLATLFKGIQEQREKK